VLLPKQDSFHVVLLLSTTFTHTCASCSGGLEGFYCGADETFPWFLRDVPCRSFGHILFCRSSFV
jgi:hypothetical protein